MGKCVYPEITSKIFHPILIHVAVISDVNMYSQVTSRSFVATVCVIVASIFWGSLVSSLNLFGTELNLDTYQITFFTSLMLLGLLLMLPVIFDLLARFYEGIKLESEIQNSIMTR